MSYLILDIETYPDTKVWTPEVKKASRKKDAPLVDVFAPLYAHRVIAIGYTLLNDNLAVEHVGCVGTSVWKDDERGLLSQFSQWASGLSGTTMVTFAGRRFDMPVLALRALRHGLPHSWYSSEHRNRYRETSHLDLFDVLTETGAITETKGFSLDTFCRLIGLPGKGGFDGSMVKGAFDRGEIAKIEGYCLQDTVRTAFLLLRYLLLRGRITAEGYHTAATTLFQKATEMNLGGIIMGADMSTLLGAAPAAPVAPVA